MFSNYYILVLVGFGLPAISFIFSIELGFVVIFILFLIYKTEKNRFQSEVDALEKKACDSIKKSLRFLQSLNQNIMVHSIRTTVDVSDIYNENNSYMEKFVKEMEQIISSYNRLMMLKAEHEIYFLKAEKAYYIEQMYNALYNFDVYKFYDKYKDIQNISNFETYQKDWFGLYFYYRN